MNKQEIVNQILQEIKDNDNEEITGSILQQNLLNIMSLVNDGNTFMGIFNSETIPSEDKNVFYIAAGSAENTNFNITYQNKVGVVQWNYGEEEQGVITVEPHWELVVLPIMTRSEVEGSIGSCTQRISALEGSVAGLNTQMAGKQDVLIFDEYSTFKSQNPVKSNGVFIDISVLQSALEIDIKSRLNALYQNYFSDNIIPGFYVDSSGKIIERDEDFAVLEQIILQERELYYFGMPNRLGRFEDFYLAVYENNPLIRLKGTNHYIINEDARPIELLDDSGDSIGYSVNMNNFFQFIGINSDFAYAIVTCKYYGIIPEVDDQGTIYEAVLAKTDRIPEYNVERGQKVDYEETVINKPRINKVVLIGDKNAEDLGLATAAQGVKADTAYQKPSGGIPYNDLSSGVKTSLDKADTALQQHQDISGKADKVSGATNNDFASLDENGNLKDSGYKASDFATAGQGTKADNAAPQTYVENVELISAAAFNQLFQQVQSIQKSLDEGLSSLSVQELKVARKMEAYPVEGNMYLVGEGAPSIIPQFRGQEYYDKTNQIWYKAGFVTDNPTTSAWLRISV